MRVAWRILMVGAALTGIVCLAITHKNPWVTFTVQSNTVLVAYYGWRLLGGQGTAALKGAVTLYLAITGVIAFFALPLPDPADGPRQVGNLLLHGVTPLMAIVDWLAFDRERRPGWADPLKWLAFPLVYAAIVLIAAPALPIRMARRYLHDSSLAWTDYALAGLAFSAAFLLAGYALIGLHRAVEAR